MIDLSYCDALELNANQFLTSFYPHNTYYYYQYDCQHYKCADRSAGPLERFACFLLSLTFRLAEFFVVLLERSRTANVLTSYARVFVENQWLTVEMLT